MKPFRGLCLLALVLSAHGQHPLPTDVKTTPDVLIPAAQRRIAPDFTLTDNRGTPLTLSAYKGTVVLLDFWATWCGGCKLELPWYIEFDREYRERGLAVIGVSTDDDGMKIVKPFMSEWHMDYPVVIGTPVMEKSFGLGQMPLTLLIDREGRIALSHAGVVDRVDFEKHIRELLR
ncbi:Peroxiredoxin [Granulicella pectinivorans]|uniref:Peroxiredoxin n=1 Tax=Granulicella pectinivorans TaxID=474950 RepID=A0A1I6L017_9BACT|nr:TlpA family protein disulfide reductase [Granulicella pectinivorans]SFR96819.1 Peroxiredoxin [Granulicella pectinivorans]